MKKALVELGAAAWASATRPSCAPGGTPGGWLAFQHRLADKLVFSKLRAKLGLDRCRFLISGGAPLAAEIAEFFHGTGLLILEGYGLTETTAAAFLNRLDRYRFGTVGPGAGRGRGKIADDGEILMRGPSVFKRYHNNPAATAEAIDSDGWFHSGDIGHLEDGFLRITDRKKDLIVLAGGKKVAPQMLENALKARCPLVSQVLVYGDRKPYCVALVTLAEEAVKKYGDGDAAKAAASPELKAAIKQAVDAVNGTAGQLRDHQELPHPARGLHRTERPAHPQPEGEAQGRHRPPPRRHRGSVFGAAASAELESLRGSSALDGFRPPRDAGSRAEPRLASVDVLRVSARLRGARAAGRGRSRR